jgi:hypothetical protein
MQNLPRGRIMLQMAISQGGKIALKIVASHRKTELKM